MLSVSLVSTTSRVTTQARRWLVYGMVLLIGLLPTAEAHQLRLARLTVERTAASLLVFDWQSNTGEARPVVSQDGSGTLVISGTSSDTPIVLTLVESDGVKRSLLLEGASQHIVPWRTDQNALDAALAYAVAGARHVLKGADHLLFLLALVMAVSGLWKLVRIVTLFTLGHAFTLAGLSLGVLRVPSSIAEIGIAITLVVTARELYRVRVLQQPPSRWFVLTAAAFGLVHGTGFAGVFNEIGLQSSGAVVALAAFNLGVEAAQLLVILLCSALLTLMTRRGLKAALLVPRLTAWVVGSAGIFWCLERV